jgi:hypothetical protein
VVDQVLVAERDAEDALRHHRRDAVLDLRLGTAVDKTSGKPPDQTDRPIGRPEQHGTGIRRHLAAVEGGHHPAALDHFIPEQVAATLRRHRGAPLQRVKALSQKNFPTFRAPMHLPPVEIRASFTPDTVHAVQVTMVARKDDAEARQVRTRLKSGTTTADGTTQGMATSYLPYGDLYETDPDTAMAWTPGGVNALQVGIEVVN